ncbi:Os03g0711900 [Oryza sativa Japonica Group]|uniref:Os03g0711900 protein n=1 Tax=Oryza sativa subsp. japonica TaxID=39947 RepID=A0A0P0W254_ORYSJ|nr:Os03g0711900 [Oryza sativa Japonica Group]
MFYSSAIHVHTSHSLQLATLALLSEMLGRGLLPTSHTCAAAAAPALLLAYGQRWKRGDKGRDNGERGRRKKGEERDDGMWPDRVNGLFCQIWIMFEETKILKASWFGR